MAIPVLLPKQGNSVETCLILGWKKKAGDEVKKGELLCEVETDKAVFEIESPSDGVLLKVFFEEGNDVPVLTNIAVIGAAGESYDEYVPDSFKSEIADKKEAKGENGGDAPFSSSVNERGRKSESLPDEPSPAKTGISPRAKRLVDKFALSPDLIKGTGPGNRIIERDVVAATRNIEPLSPAAGDAVNEGYARPETGSGIGKRITSADVKTNQAAKTSALSGEDVKVVPLKGMRKIIADRMLDSLRNSAQLTLQSSADATALLNLRKRFKGSSVVNEFQSVTITDLVHYAVIKTLQACPELNSLLVGDRIEYHKKVHLGFAVDTPRGLMVPVIKDSQDLSLLQLSNEAKRLASASLSGRISIEELNGGTFTVTNLGGFQIESFTPVLNLPQTGILGVNAISPRPVDRGRGVELVPYISFSLTIDHRVIDGAVGARFLQNLAARISEIN
jgi:pyruvate dehydrogenase E2 component (dihydrolipoamide acetyltransferase)